MHWPSETVGMGVTVGEERLSSDSLRLPVSIALEKGVVDEAAHFVVARKQKDRVHLPWPPLSALLQLCPTS